jgi:two-component system response regulator AtoC
LVKLGSFREDLFFRLRVLEIHLPPLRERKQDIPLLAQAFVREFARENDKPVRDIGPEVMDALLAYSWPGNVRELRTSMEHAVVLCRSDRVDLRDLPQTVRQLEVIDLAAAKKSQAPSGELSVKEAEKQLIIRALKECNGSRTDAAKKLGMSRRTLHRKLHTYHLEGF